MILSHDLGTTGNKATLVSNDGHLVSAVAVKYGADFGKGGRAEQNPDDWWVAVCTATRRLLERSGRAATDIDVVSFSGQMMGVVALGPDGRPVRPAIIWADTRSSQQAEALVARVGMKRAYGITGHRINPTYSLSKIMWVRDTEPDAFRNVRVVLQAKDYMAYLLTGELATDPSDASGTNAFDQNTATWSDDLIDAAELSRHLFPAIVPSTHVLGTVTHEAAEQSGLASGTRVVIGGGDGPMAALGAGITDSTSGAYAYLGSSSWVSVSADAPLHDPLMRSMTFNHVVPGQFVPTATMQAGGASLQWVTGILGGDHVDQYAELLALAEKSAAADDGLFFLPHLLGERSPYWNPRARAAFVGVLMHHDRGNLTRAVLEGVAFNLRTGLQAFSDCGVSVSRIDAIGGAAHAGVLLDIFAQVWGVPVSARDVIDEANSIGAAVVGGIGVGIFENFHIAAQFSSRTQTRHPDPARAASYDTRYAEFLDAYARLEPWFDALPPS